MIKYLKNRNNKIKDIDINKIQYILDKTGILDKLLPIDLNFKSKTKIKQ